MIQKVFTPSTLVGAALTVLCGLLLWGTPAGDAWVNSSYDNLFRFGARAVTNQVALILMDNSSYDFYRQDRVLPWDRGLHAQLLNKLTADGARLVVFDILFAGTNNPTTDSALAQAMRANGNVVLAALADEERNSKIDPLHVTAPDPLFLNAAAGCGIGKADATTGGLVRRHWPFFSPGEGDFHSLGWVAAEKYDPQFDRSGNQQWLRYYGAQGTWQEVPYQDAMKAPPGYFRGKVVFVGSWPVLPSDPAFQEGSNDKFRTPYTRWNGPAVGGVAIMATTFLNLANSDWLRRPPAAFEFLLIFSMGIILGGGLCRLNPLAALLAAAGLFLAVLLLFVSLSYFTNYWFPWLILAGGQAPFALAWAWVSRQRTVTVFHTRYPGYEPVGEPFGKGAYGKVFRVRNVTGQFEALKEVQRSTFNDDGPYEREFRGIKSYKPVSAQHPGLLNIGYVNRNESEGYFYYVMELGDPLDPDWEQKGALYQPSDLNWLCRLKPGRKLPPHECMRIGIELLEALDFLHQHKLVHRDIKPSNIVFVNGRPKLADVGLVREVGPDGTLVGTVEYMPPPPEPPGTEAADIYAMGMMLYVISTGNQPAEFAKLSTALVEQPDFMRLNAIICKACQPSAAQRYPRAADMCLALRAAQNKLGPGGTQVI